MSEMRSMPTQVDAPVGRAARGAFAVIEARSRHALLPVRLLADRNRAGAYLIMLGEGTAIFGMFFFLTLFMQSVWGDTHR
jgi:hypothetical protein